MLSHRSEKWTWNYWQRNALEAKTMPYPDDLDDTFCSLSALYLYDNTFITPQIMGHIVHTLTRYETQPGGPYKTWIVSSDAEMIWQDVDIAVNANIAYFLSLQNITLPNLSKLFDTAIVANNYTSPYYPFPYPFIYFLSRFYRGNQQDALRQYIFSLQNKEKYWDNPLYTALAVTSLLNLGTKSSQLTESIAYLLKKQNENGSWQPNAFYTGVNPKRDKKYFAGSTALTTAFCIETLNKFRIQDVALRVNKKINHHTIQEEKIQKMILHKTELMSKRLSSDLQIKLSGIVQKLTQKDSQKHILLLPYFFAQSLSKKNQALLIEEFLVTLGFANLLGWIAYTIYDDFLDNQGKTQLLSLANVCLRQLTSIFLSILPENKEFISFFHEVMNQLDAANNWEVIHCRLHIGNNQIDLASFVLPEYANYEKLSQKSFGHVLGPLAILFSLGYPKNSIELQLIIKFFRHYIVAKQLNDDAHDVFADLQTGFCTPVVSVLLQQYRAKYPSKKKLSGTTTAIKKFFWEHTIDTICQEIFSQCESARKILKKTSLIENPELLTNLIRSLEKAAQKALDERKKTVEFLTAYAKDSSS